MSYSFTVRAANRTEVLAKVAAELDNVKFAQPMHSHDRDQALAAAISFVAILPESKEGHEIQVSVHGSVGWTAGEGENPNVVISAGVGVSASIVQATAS